MPRRLRPLCPALVLACSLLPACSAGEPPTLTVGDSAGVEVVESSGPFWQRGEAWRLAPRPDLTVGGPDDPADPFTWVTDVAQLPGGRIAVADGGARTLRWHGPDGGLVAAWGPARGGPPDAFVGLESVAALPGDSLLAFDRTLARATIFDETGAPVREMPLGSLGYGEPVAVEPLSGGRLVVAFETGAPDPEVAEPGIRRLSSPLVVWTPGQRRILPLGELPGREVAFTDLGRQVVRGMAPWGRSLALAVWADTLYLGTTETWSFQVWETDGGTPLRHVRARGFDPTLDAADVEAFRTAYLRGLPDDAARASLERYFGAVPLPPARAAYSRLLVDPAGNVWMSGYETPSFSTGPWRVFDPDGRYLGEVQVPPELGILEVGDGWVLGRWAGEARTQSVRRYPLEKG